jgi:hypothetical protein
MLGARVALARLRADKPRPQWHRPAHPAPAPAPTVAVHVALRVEEIRFRRLRTADEIACVLPLRREINLPRAGDPGFAALEKKEMRSALSAHSSIVDKPSARSASFPWATGLRRARKSLPATIFHRTCSPMAGK